MTTTADLVDPALKALFRTEFYAERANYANTPSASIRGAGKATKANPRGEDELWWLAKGPEMLQNWQTFRERTHWDIWRTPDGTPAIELEVTGEFDGVLVKMFIDRVFRTESGALVILDLKSGSRTPVSDLQLGFYAGGVRQKFGVDVHGGVYWMAREGTCTPVVSLDMWTPRLLGHYARQLQTARREGIYLPNVTAMCRACGVRRYCAAVGGEMSHRDPDYQFIRGDQE